MRSHHVVACISLAAVGVLLNASVACTGEDPIPLDATRDAGSESDGSPIADAGSDTSTLDPDGGPNIDPPPAIENRTSWAFHVPTSGYLFTPVAAAADGYGVAVHNYLKDVPGLPPLGGKTGIVVVFFDSEGRAPWRKGVVVAGNAFGVTSVAFDDAGDIYLGGGIGGSADFGNDVVVPAPPSGSANQGFVVKLRRTDGQGVWSKVFATPPGGSATLNSFAIRGDTLAIAGTNDGGLSLEGTSGQVTVGVKDHIFLANLELSTGKARWARGYRVEGNDYAGQVDALALDASGNVYFGGGFRGTYLGFLTLKSPGTAVNGYIASADAAGKLRWQRNFGSPSASDPTAVGSLALGKNALVVGGQVAANADFGDGKPVGSNGLSDAYVAAYDPATGDHRWHLLAGGDDGSVDGERISGIAVDRWDQIVAVGDYRKPFTIDGKLLPSPPEPQSGSAPPRALFGLKADATGKALWSKAVVSPTYASARSVAATPSGSFIVGCALQGQGIDLGAGTIANTGGGYNWDLGVLGWTP